MTPERLVRAAADTGLDGVAVTDHNTMDGVADAVAAAPEGLLVIPGEEVDTPTGQLIGLCLESPIEPWQPAETVIDRIHEQGGIAFAPHPFDAFREGLSDVASHADALDAVETVNGRCVRNAYNDRAAAFAASHGVPAVGGSDAHFPGEVGNAWVEVQADERTEAAVAAAVRAGDTRAAGGRGSLLNHVGTKLLKLSRR